MSQMLLPEFSTLPGHPGKVAFQSAFFAASSTGSPSPFRDSEGAAKRVAVLFARSRSVYSRVPGCDVWDAARDARHYFGNLPVIAHPPCRAWGRLKGQAKPRPDERQLSFFAVDAVRRCGGVLEHPAASSLWPAAGLPQPGEVDEFGGFTFPILQSWFGHRAPKATWLYIVGTSARNLPEIPFELGIPAHRVEMMGRSERESTPFELATWLFAVAELCRKPVGSPASAVVRVLCNTRTSGNGLPKSC